MIENMIKKHGQAIKINDTNTIAYVNYGFSSIYKKKSAELTGLRFANMLTRERVDVNSDISIENTLYKVLSTQAQYKSKKYCYSDSQLFEDDFIHNINIHTAFLENKIGSYPKIGDSLLETKARIKQANPQILSELIYYTQMQITHIITVAHSAIPKPNNLIIKENETDKGFQIIKTEDLDSQGSLLLMYCVEVLL